MKRRAKNITTSSLVVASVFVFLFAGMVCADVYNHVSIDVSSLAGEKIQLEMQLFDNTWIAGDSWVLVDNVNLGTTVVDFETATLEGFDDSLNPDQVGPVPGNLNGSGSYLMRIDEDPVVSWPDRPYYPIITWRDFSPSTATTLSFDYKLVSDGAVGPWGQDLFVVYLKDPDTLLPFPSIPGIYGMGDILEESASGVTSTSVADVTVVPAPGAFLLGSLGLAFASWKLQKRKKL